jgi:predicted Zn-dependent peptidase
MKYEYHEFKNGIRLVHRHQKGSVAHLGVMIHAGSRDESADQQGLAHFIEHMVFKGTEKRSNAQVLGRLENVGADLNAFTTREDTSIYASVASRYFERALELLSDIVFHSVFPIREIEKEKAVIIDEINSYRDNPSEWIHDEFDELIFPDHPLGRNILGTPAALKKYTRADILRFRDQNYLPQRIVISSVSAFPLAKVIHLAEKHFGEITAGTEGPVRMAAGSYNPQQRIRKYARHQSHVVIGNVACNAHDPDRIPMALLNNMLGGPAMNSRLNLALREKNGIAYNLESNFQPYADTGIFSIYCGTDDTLMDRALELIHKELSRFRDTRLSTQALHTARQQLKGQLLVSLESRQGEMLAMGKNMMVYNRVEPVENICHLIDQVTAEDMLRMAGGVFAANQLSMLLYTHKKQE